MRFFGLILLLGWLPALATTSFKTQINDVDFGKQFGEEILVFLTSGHVAKLNRWDTDLLDRLHAGKSTSKWFSITMDRNRFITKLESTTSPIPSAEPESRKPLIMTEDYIPTTIESVTVAKKYFREAKRPAKEETQCFNRAMVWGYEWWKKHSLKSNKLLIYFTRNYIRRYNFEWWFHITPAVHIMDNGTVVERAMDVKYTGGPIPFRKWSNIFMKNDAECPVITRYSEYADNPYSGECFLQRTYMYTYQPADLQMHEAWGYTKDAFNMNEVKAAYQEAFTAPPPPRETEGETEGETGENDSGSEGE